MKCGILFFKFTRIQGTSEGILNGSLIWDSRYGLIFALQIWPKWNYSVPRPQLPSVHQSLKIFFLNPACKSRTPGSCFQLPPHSYMHTYKPKISTNWPQFPYFCLEKKKKMTVVQLTLINISWTQLNETTKIYLQKPKVPQLTN